MQHLAKQVIGQHSQQNLQRKNQEQLIHTTNTIAYEDALDSDESIDAEYDIEH